MRLSIATLTFLAIFSMCSNADVRYWKLAIAKCSNKDEVVDTVWFKSEERGAERKSVTTFLIRSLKGEFVGHFPNLDGYRIESFSSGQQCRFRLNGTRRPNSAGDGNSILNAIAEMPHDFIIEPKKHTDFIIPLFPLIQSDPLSIASMALDASGLRCLHFGNRGADAFSCLRCETFVNDQQQRRWIFRWVNNDFSYTLHEISQSETDPPQPEEIK